MLNLKKNIYNTLHLKISTSEGLYLVKCIIGAVVCYVFSTFLPQYPIYWALISVVIVFSPDNNNKLAYDRIKSNLLGATIGFLLFFIPLSNLVLISLGVALTILTGIALHLGNALRSALAAMLIVLIEENELNDWTIAIERVICVGIGCLVALVITYVFSKAGSLIKH